MQAAKINFGGGHAADHGDLDIAGLAADSRKVEPGFLFAALPGAGPDAAIDGRDFIGDAVRRGAVAILGPTGLATGLKSTVGHASVEQEGSEGTA